MLVGDENEAGRYGSIKPKRIAVNIGIRTARTAVVGLLVLGVIVFLPAGTLAYWQGWAFIVVFSVSTNLIGIYLAFKDPALLERRIRAGPAQKRGQCKRPLSLSLSLVRSGW